jgi:hypothetical protein
MIDQRPAARTLVSVNGTAMEVITEGTAWFSVLTCGR